MFMVGIIETCKDYGLANLLGVTQNIMTFMQIMVPILAIVSIIKILSKLVINPDDKKLRNSIRNWFLAFLIFFLLPVAVNTTMNLIDPEYSIAACWEFAKQNNNNGSAQTNYIVPHYEEFKIVK